MRQGPMDLWETELDRMELVVESVGVVTVVQLSFESLNSGNVREFKSKIEGYLKPDTKMVLDMGKLRFVDSSGIGAILSFTKALAAVKGSLKLCSVSDPVQNLFQLIHMDRILEVYPTREEAIGSFEP